MRRFMGKWMMPLAAMALVACLAGTDSRAQGRDCTIEGPTNVAANQSFTLCASDRNGDFNYSWRGPGVNARSSCITIPGQPAGDYQYQLSTWINGVEQDRCVHTVHVGSWQDRGDRQDGGWQDRGDRQDGGWTDVSDNPCGIEGPQWIGRGQTGRLCAGLMGGQTYRWTSPNGQVVMSRCVTVSMAGTYYLTTRDPNTGAVRRCSYVVRDRGVGNDDPDVQMTVNCPRTATFWREQMPGQFGGLANRDVPIQTLREIARRVDQRSRYFNWSNDLNGLRSALSPARPMTFRKNLAREFAALLANVAAGDMNLAADARPVGNGPTSDVGIEANTRISYRGARTVQDLIIRVDNMLMSRTAADMDGAARYLQDINRGVGIGPTCD